MPRTMDIAVQEHDLIAGGVRLHCRRVGDPDAPPVLFLHGVMGHRRDWDVFVDALAAHHHVVVPDLRGHGLSEWTRTYSVTELAGDATALLTELGFDRGTPVVGHSLGGLVAMVVAARRPDLVSRLVMIDITPSSLDSPFGRQLPSVIRAMGETTYPSIGEAVDDWLAGNPLAQPELLANYVRHALVPTGPGQLQWGFDTEGLARLVLHGMPQDELEQAADLVRAPSLVVTGEHSPLVGRADASLLARRLPAGRVALVPDGGHDLGVEQPHAVAAAVAGFLEDGARP